MGGSTILAVIVIAVLVLWIWGVADLLKRDVRGPVFYKWLGIIVAFPIIGFFLYFQRRRRLTS